MFVYCIFGLITISMRRLMARPSAVSLEAKGRLEPYPTEVYLRAGKV